MDDAYGSRSSVFHPYNFTIFSNFYQIFIFFFQKSANFKILRIILEY